MRTESNIIPSNFVVENDSVVFTENITEIEKEEGTFYAYDMYRLFTPIREGLEEEIESNFNTWLELARNTEQKELADVEIKILKKQLADTDYQAIKYSEGWLTEEEYTPIKAQREAWRDRIRELSK